MKTNNNKGFTIVELVIVIAVIAILAAVLIPTFSNIVDKANKSKYLQEARNALTEVIAENNGTVENHTYLTMSKGDEEVAWYEYVDGELTVLEARPEVLTNDVNYGFRMSKDNTDYLKGEVAIYRPVVKDVVDKLNALLVDESAETYEKIGDAGKELADLEMDIINFRESGYKFAYSLTTNKVFIANDNLTEVKYSNTGISTIPADKRILTGVNINTAQDLVEFSKVTNLHENEIPTEENVFVKGSPIVICNLNNNIDMSSTDGFLTLAFWDQLDYLWNGKKYYAIQILLNGNDNAINNLSEPLIGALELGSMIRNINLSYLIGREGNPETTGRDPAPNNNSGSCYFYGLFARGIVARSMNCTPEKTIRISDVSMGGQVYLKNGDGGMAEMGVFFGGIANSGATGTMLDIKDVSLFNKTNDKLQFTKVGGDGFGIIVGNPEKVDVFSTENVIFSETNINGLFGSSLGTSKFYGIIA